MWWHFPKFFNNFFFSSTGYIQLSLWDVKHVCICVCVHAGVNFNFILWNHWSHWLEKVQICLHQQQFYVRITCVSWQDSFSRVYNVVESTSIFYIVNRCYKTYLPVVPVHKFNWNIPYGLIFLLFVVIRNLLLWHYFFYFLKIQIKKMFSNKTNILFMKCYFLVKMPNFIKS